MTAPPAQRPARFVKRVPVDIEVEYQATEHLRSGGGMLRNAVAQPDASHVPQGESAVGEASGAMGGLAASFPTGRGGLSSAQVGELVALLDESRMTQGKIGPDSTNNLVRSIRSGAVQWLGSEEIGEQLYSHLLTLAVVANRERRWNFTLEGITPFLQATRYDAAGREHYGWHMDWGLGRTRMRKVTVVVHLTDASEFEGGALQLTTGSNPVEAVQLAGTCTVFPSFLLHCVTPVTAGTRLGAVAWALGAPFR